MQAQLPFMQGAQLVRAFPASLVVLWHQIQLSRSSNTHLLRHHQTSHVVSVWRQRRSGWWAERCRCAGSLPLRAALVPLVRSAHVCRTGARLCCSGADVAVSSHCLYSARQVQPQLAKITDERRPQAHDSPTSKLGAQTTHVTRSPQLAALFLIKELASHIVPVHCQIWLGLFIPPSFASHEACRHARPLPRGVGQSDAR